MTEYQIKYVEIENYRQYANEQRVHLATTSDKRINLIEGQNGAGKSNFLNAIALCLYGSELHGSEESGDDDASLPWANYSRLQEVSTDESVEGRIEVCFQRGQSEYLFSREFETYKTDSGFTNSLEELQLHKQENGDWIPVENPNSTLNDIIPHHIYKYHIFDGEALDELFQEDSVQEVKDGVLDVSQVSLLDRAIYHFEKVLTDLERESADLGGRTAEVIEEINEVEEQITETKQTIEDLKNEREEAAKRIEDIDETLADARNERVIELRAEREELEQRQVELESELVQLKEDAGDVIMSAGPPIFGASAVDETATLLSQTLSDDAVPAGLESDVVDELLERGICLCGRDLDSEPDAREHLVEVEAELETSHKLVREGRKMCPDLLQIADERMPRVQTVRERMRDIEDSLSTVQVRLEDISNNLKSYNIPDVDIEEKEAERQEMTDRREELSRRIGSLENDLDDLESEKSELETKRDTERKKDDRQKLVDMQIQFTRAATERVENIREAILSDIRVEIEASMNTYFNDLIWKSDEFDVELHDDYTISVYRTGDDEDLIQSLSAGERQVLALSFMAAVANISGYHAPMVIDTPLGRISSAPRKKIAQNLTEYMEDTQITFLMTDEEYRGQVQAMMEPDVANAHHLDYDQETTEVIARE